MSATDCPHCGGVDSWHHDLTECVGRLKAQLSEAKLENEAWRALAIESSGRAVSLDFTKYGPGVWGAELADYPNTIGRTHEDECVFNHDTPQAAAIDLATKLNLLTPKA